MASADSGSHLRPKSTEVLTGVSIVSLVFGILCIVNAFGLVKLAFWVIGAALIYNGISNIYIAIASSKTERQYRKSQEAIDVEFVDDKEE